MFRRIVRKLDLGIHPARMTRRQGFNADFQQREDYLLTNRAPRRPEGLYQGDSFTLSNNGVEIQLVKVVDGNYSVRRVN